MSYQTLFARLPDGSTKPVTMQEILKAAQRTLGNRKEVFSVIFVDKGNHILEYIELFRGSLDVAGVYNSREIVKKALEQGAAACVFVHNHSYCDVQEICADVLIIKRLTEALGLVDVRVLDHIVGGGIVAAFAKTGLS